MPKHEVMCRICGERFDLNSVQGVKLADKRYAHQVCAPDKEPVLMEAPKVIKTPKKVTKVAKTASPEEEQLNQYIMQLYGTDFVPPIIQKQIKQYIQEYHFTYMGIYKTLYWYYGIKGNPVKKDLVTLGLVPYIYQDAKDYYYTLFLAETANKNLQPHQAVVKEITIPSPEVYIKPPRLFNLEED